MPHVAILLARLQTWQIKFTSGRFYVSFSTFLKGVCVMDNLVPIVIMLVIVVALIVAMWRVFEKAGQPGWGSLIPIYNLYLMLQIAGRPGWWLILCFIPILNLVLLVLPFDIARSFGKDTLFGLGLLFLGFIFYPILAFGDAQYIGPQV
jgi:hypothetical protein